MSVPRGLLHRRMLPRLWLNVPVLTSQCGGNASIPAKPFNFQHTIKPIGMLTRYFFGNPSFRNTTTRLLTLIWGSILYSRSMNA